ncbi:hypothetical protein CEUSTIGMA_g7011.t1 [Chlamydomonas eustigma]|uniref:Uncharacterized protein n=1 Tax=Chlamydomonas eustigma TaxID=1157962 RepID=A0A250X9X7_9CHLO|nr:hypothetical protein CEUSTIGMA_g7011.t1 [Chlamydomonas eustigma]|eukprot:GAX79570.1 hypothetical protein CEUSTIGMA_g7011.t1 [Chlamydomonas eustigma]
MSHVSYPGMTTLHLNSRDTRDTPSQPLANPRDYVRNAHPVHSILDCRIQTDPDSRARPKSKCLFFKVRWSTPNPDQPIDTWEPMRSLTKLTAFKDFLSSPTWSTFVQTPAYLCFARLYKTKIPKGSSLRSSALVHSGGTQRGACLVQVGPCKLTVIGPQHLSTAEAKYRFAECLAFVGKMACAAFPGEAYFEGQERVEAQFKEGRALYKEAAHVMGRYGHILARDARRGAKTCYRPMQADCRPMQADCPNGPML